jgi:hypothetical protein
MSLVHTTVTRNALAQATQLQCDSGSGHPNAIIQLATDSGFGTILSTLQMSSASFGTASGGVITANSITPDSSAAGTGTAAYFRICNRAGTEVLRGTVTAVSGGDIVLNSTSIVTGATVSISSLTWAAPA